MKKRLSESIIPVLNKEQSSSLFGGMRPQLPCLICGRPACEGCKILCEICNSNYCTNPNHPHNPRP